MATEAEIKEELLEIVRQKGIKEQIYQNVVSELDDWASKESIDDKSILQKFYSQIKSKKVGHKNPWNSWAAFCLGVTTKEPTTQFYFPKRRVFARPSPPDIDSDFDYERRQEIIDFLVNMYGRGQVGNIGTYGGLKMRSCLTRIIKALDIANAFKDGSQAYTTKNVEKVEEIVGSLPKNRGALIKVNHDVTGEEIVLKTIKDVLTAESKDCDDFRTYMEMYPDILKHTKNIEGLLSIFGVHASGVVLSDIPLERIAPLRTAKDYGSGDYALATQFAYEDLESLGLVKFDILAISTLTVIAETVKIIKEDRGISIDIENLPLDDRKTLDLYKRGELVGVFQCESRPMQKTCVDIGVDRFEDIMAAISLFRPGPMESIPEYCERKNGRKKISYFHPTIEPYVKDILSTTYGILCYQEQVMRICESLGDMTPTKALIVIKGIGKKDENVIAKGRSLFIKGAVGRGVPKDVAEQYWDKFITPFAMYGFNLSHSCCYAYNSYITAYLKANFPEEFMCSYLNVEIRRRKLERVIELEKECKRMGMILSPRDINKCELNYRILSKGDAEGIFKSEIRPTIHCKGLSTAAAANIVQNRPYNSIRELAEKTDSSVVDMESITALCDAKFNFKTKRETLLKEFSIIREDLKLLRRKGRPSDNLFSEE